MKYDIVLAGVGGQGILTIAYLLDNLAVRKGLRIKQSEVHGMAQRGGAVYSHMRISDDVIISDLIPDGAADMILSVEPLEVQRYLHLLGPRGVVVSSNQPFINITDYPPEEQVLEALLRLSNALLINAKKIAAASKSPRSQNVAMVGAATPFLPFEAADFVPIIEELFASKGEAVVNSNIQVLENASSIGSFYKELLDGGVANDLAYTLVERIQVGSFAPELADDYAKALAAKPTECKKAISSLDEDVPQERALLDMLKSA